MKSITIGRDDSCDIIINHERVSRFHASITREGDRYLYRDMSSNGTLINGVLIKNRDIYIRFGDRVLLAGNIPLPWNQIQNMTASADTYIGGSDYKRERAYDSARAYDEDESVTYQSGTVLIVFGYITAVLGGLLAFILGPILISSKQTTPRGKKVHKYKPSAVTNGWVIIGIAIISSIVQLIYLSKK
ncbi:MAG: FHA domain-containing protein [Candidatus Azobacteroides sp.]|nr:FHA domain-containing protein [Candidatus Azobacteroides sp.]